MKVFKKLLSDSNNKIHIDEIALKIGTSPSLLSDAVIVQEGSNSNGEYVRFGNGLQVCWNHSFTVNWTGNTTFIKNNWNFPAAFVSSTATSITAMRQNYWGRSNIARSNTTADVNSSGNYADVRLWTLLKEDVHSGSSSAVLRLIAIGYWR